MVNSELVDKYGNYIYRMESFIEKNNLSPAVPESLDKNDIEVLDLLRDKFARSSIKTTAMPIAGGCIA